MTDSIDVPQVSFSPTVCRCALCLHALPGGAISWDGTESASCVQSLHQAVLQAHRSLHASPSYRSPVILTDEQRALLRSQIAASLSGVADDLVRIVELVK